MAATDAYGNPGTVAPDELIESAWGNATRATVVKRYPTLAAWAAANPAPPDGAAFSIVNMLGVASGGRLVAQGDTAIAAATVSGANLSPNGSTSLLSGSLAFPNLPYQMTYLVLWVSIGSGQANAGKNTIGPSIRDGAGSTVYAQLTGIEYIAGASPTWTLAAFVTVPPSTAGRTATFWATVGAVSGANINVGGYALALGFGS